MDDMVTALCSEISMRRNELPTGPLGSIYLGGGTPSILPDDLLFRLFNHIYNNFSVASNAEITIEANPDDISTDKLRAIKQTPVNRFSMGIQSFFDEDLLWMNRAHKSSDAEASIQMIQDSGFDKVTIDLIYGGPTLTDEHWEQNLQKAINLSLEHISAYCLTAEPQTALFHHIQKGLQPALDEEKAERHFNMLVDTLENAGFEQYEISNFARNQAYAKHNSSYWSGQPYLGIGPSAHSFNGINRSWNIAANRQYIAAIEKGHRPAETETLTPENRINEYLMTGLRTIWGCRWEHINAEFGTMFAASLQQKLLPFIEQGAIEHNPHFFRLTRKARILADGIAAELFF